MDIPTWFMPEFTEFHIYGLIFLLGSFTVASLSDIKYMKAQAEFGEVWILCFVAFLIYELWAFGDQDNIQFAAKWGIIILFIAISNMHIGIILKLAWGDIFACMAVMAMLTAGLIVIFILALIILKTILRPFLKMFGSGDAYPFMPVVMGATIGVLAVAFYVNSTY
jgi:hypothetical protein